MEMESARVWIFVRAVELQYLCVHRSHHTRTPFANRSFQSRGENRRAFSNHRFARAELDLFAPALAKLLGRYVVEGDVPVALVDRAVPCPPVGRTRPSASSMLNTDKNADRATRNLCRSVFICG